MRETFDINKPNENARIVRLLKERGSRGAYIYEFMTPRPLGGLGISQYGRAIYHLRHDFGFNIKNIEPGHFVLVERPEQQRLFDQS